MYDALIVRINPGQLSQGTPEGTQAMFDDLMNAYISEGKLVWSSPKIQTQMGAKDALVNIGKLNCGLEDTYAYYSEADLVRAAGRGAARARLRPRARAPARACPPRRPCPRRHAPARLRVPAPPRPCAPAPARAARVPPS